MEDERIAEGVEMTSIEPLTDDSGKEVEGCFVAHVKDKEIIAGYETKSVITVNDLEANLLESEPVDIARGRTLELNWLKIAGVEAVDDGNGTMMVKLPYGINNMNSLPVEYASGAMSVIAEGYDDEVKDCGSLDFSLPVTLIVTSLSGETKEYKVVPYFSNLPVVYMTTPLAITSKDVWTADCEMQIWNAGDKDGTYQKVNVKGRGNTTWSYPKKPYAIKLNKKAEVLGMPKHKRWCLLANWMDRTVMRNDVAFEIGRRLTGLDWTPHGEYVDVVFNGRMVGNYYLCEQIKVDENRVDIVEMESDDVSEETITGGYLVELDTYFDEVNKFRTKRRNLPVNIKEPDEDVLVPAQLDYIQGYFNRIEDILYGGASGDVFDLIDVDSFVDWWLVYELAFCGEPGHPKSSYMHKDRGGKLKAGPIWDFDWGSFYTFETRWRNQGSIYYNDLFKKHEFVAKVKERWETAKLSLVTIPDYIDKRYLEIQESAELNGKMWPISIVVNQDEKLSVTDAVERMKTRYTQRFEWMDQQIQAM
ncbi:MAG: CotH kinase family protein [Muribaculaceae bacterium]|nr:CotH kinase family protein [Muribaculaceae bacterium]